jgi:MoxR-like ATPase
MLEDTTAGRRSFRFVKGPIFAQLLMADEINRASPKTQSALLQAMQEHHVTVAGLRHDVPAPFHVLATQNPLEQEGTYPLPEAQLDRFLMQIDITYPDETAERRMLFATTGLEQRNLSPVFSGAELLATQRLVRQIPVGDSVVEAILRLVRAARPGTPEAAPRVNELVAWGPGPRAGRPPCALRRRRHRPRRAGAETPHGAVFRRQGGRHHHQRGRGRPDGDAGMTCQ